MAPDSARVSTVARCSSVCLGGNTCDPLQEYLVCERLLVNTERSDRVKVFTEIFIAAQFNSFGRGLVMTKTSRLATCGFLLCLCSAGGFQAIAAENTTTGWLHGLYNPYPPIFTPEPVKLRELSDPAYSSVLVEEAARFERLLVTNGTQMNMGFFSGRGNLGGVVNFVNILNYKGNGAGCQKAAKGGANCAIYIKGATDDELYPENVKTYQEHWDDRAAAAGKPTVIIYGKVYPNINPVDKDAYTKVWGQMSERYANMARIFHAKTNNKVKVWVLVYGATTCGLYCQKEYPQLVKLESENVIEVRCAKKLFADPTVPREWDTGTSSPYCKQGFTKARAATPEGGPIPNWADIW